MIRKIIATIFILVALLQPVNTSYANNAIVADNRFTAEAMASDYSQCGSLITIYILTYALTYAATLGTCLYATGGAGVAACAKAAKIAASVAAMAALTAVYYAYSEWAKDIRANSKVVNTIDKEKPQCGKPGQLDHKKNFIHDDFGEYRGWTQTGPLGNYCYHEEFDHHLPKNEKIYNDGAGKIGISYAGQDPVWIEPEDCKKLKTDDFLTMIDADRIFCAWYEGDEICAEGVFCTSLGIGDFLPIYGFVGDPTRLSSEARRSCGKDPYSDGSLDDFATNKRCECLCCDGSENYPICNELKKYDRSCKTYNERYYAHCVKRPYVEEDINNPISPPVTVSAHCDMKVNAGYKDFPFSGKALRCFIKTVENIYFGREDVFVYDENGEYLVDQITLIPVFNSRCINGLEDERGCIKAMYRIMQKNVEGVVTSFLIIWMFFFGISLLIDGLGSGNIMKKGQFFLHIFKFSVVIYFVQGDAWKDGFFDVLMRGGYEVSQAFFAVSTDYAEQIDIAELTGSTTLDLSEELDAELYAQCSFNDLPIPSSRAWENIQNCSFFDGLDPNGLPYPEGDEYFAVLDSFDCKFSQYIGFDKNNYFPDIFRVALGMIFSSPMGIFFFAASLSFFVYSVLMLLKVTYMLLVSALMLTFLIYISPIIIPLVLMQRTKQIFDKWLSTIMGYALQPFLVLVFIALVISLVDIFFVAYIAPVYGIASDSREVVLGISFPRIVSDVDTDVTIANMCQFAFLLVVLDKAFDQFTSIVSALTGTSQIGKTPGFGKAMEKAKNYGKKGLKAASAYGGAKRRQAIGQMQKGVEQMTKSGEEAAGGGGASGGAGGQQKPPAGGAGGAGGAGSGGAQQKPPSAPSGAGGAAGAGGDNKGGMGSGGMSGGGMGGPS